MSKCKMRYSFVKCCLIGEFIFKFGMGEHFTYFDFNSHFKDCFVFSTYLVAGIVEGVVKMPKVYLS